MKTFNTFLLLASASTAYAFVPSSRTTASSQLGVTTKGKIGPFRKSIAAITKDNFSTTLVEIEPFLNEDAGMTIYIKSMRRISSKAKEFGIELPSTFAKDAKCMEKRRAKQNAYCETKAQEIAAAAAAEAEAKAAAIAAEAAAKAEAEAAAIAAEAAAKAEAEASAVAVDDSATVDEVSDVNEAVASEAAAEVVLA